MIPVLQERGQTALSLACKVGRVDMAEYLLREADANVDVIDLGSGMSPLMYAIAACNADLVLALLLKDASIDLCDFKCITPMMLACASKSENLVIAKTLYTMSKTALNIDAQDERGWTALHYAVYSNSPKVLEYLLTECVANKNLRDVNKKKPMHLAVYLKRGDCESMLEDRRTKMARAAGDDL